MYNIMIIPDGVGLKNILLNGFLQQPDQDDYMVFDIFDQPDLEREYAALRVRHQRMLHYHEGVVTTLLRYALMYAQLHWAKTVAMVFNLNKPVKGSLRRKLMRRSAQLLGRMMNTPQRIRLLEWLHAVAVRRQPEFTLYVERLRALQPRVVVTSHQRPPNINPLILAARALGIPTATFIFSWDNLTSKGRIAVPFDHYLVWSDLMRSELLQYYPDVRPEQVHIVGTPQFESYADRTLLWSREEFFARIGADPARPLICYSGGDTGTCPEDPGHVRILLELIRSDAIDGSPQVLLRPAPVDDGARYAGVQIDFPELIFAQPEWEHSIPGDWSQAIPTRADVQFLANLTQHADLNVNMASTMTLDFAIHDKPVVNLAFDIADPPLFGQPIWDLYYHFDHYRPIIYLGAARFARSAGELAEHINTYLADPSLDRAARQALVALEVGVPVGQANRRILEVFKKVGR